MTVSNPGRRESGFKSRGGEKVDMWVLFLSIESMVYVSKRKRRESTQALEKWSRAGQGSGHEGSFGPNSGWGIPTSSRRERCNARRYGRDSKCKAGQCINTARTNNSGGMKRATSEDTMLRCREGIRSVGRLRHGPHHREAPRFRERREDDHAHKIS